VDALRQEVLKPEEAVDPSKFGTKNRDELYMSKIIPIQFDYRDETLGNFRSFAQNAYWYLCGFLTF